PHLDERLCRLGRRQSGQPFAEDQGKGIFERSIGARLHLRVAAMRILVLDARGQVARHARHAVCAKRLDARTLGRLEHEACRSRARSQLVLKLYVLAARARGARLLCSFTSWQPAVSAKLSAQPRMTEISRGEGTREGSGSCTCLG